jgi:hypothetical protein
VLGQPLEAQGVDPAPAIAQDHGPPGDARGRPRRELEDQLLVDRQRRVVVTDMPPAPTSTVVASIGLRIRRVSRQESATCDRGDRRRSTSLTGRSSPPPRLGARKVVQSALV